MSGDATDVLGRRIGAALLDVLLLFAVFVGVGLVGGDASARGGEASVTLGSAATLVFALLSLLYYGLSEATSGQTLGKRAMGVKVVGEDGAPVTPRAAVVRTLMRVVDSLPVLYLVGLASILLTGHRRQRVGDLVARTRVVSARSS